MLLKGWKYMSDNNLSIYQCVISVRNNDVSLRWQRTQIFLIINTGILAVIKSLNTAKQEFDAVLCGGGIIICIIWLLAMRLGGVWVEFWDGRLADIEKALEKTDPEIVTVFNNELFNQQKKDHRFLDIQMSLPLVFMLGWVYLFYLSKLA